METKSIHIEYNKTQLSILTKSLIIAGCFFVVIGLLSFGISRLLLIDSNWFINNALYFIPFVFISLLFDLCISWIWVKTFNKHNKKLIPLIYSLYTISMTFLFGYIFSIIQYETNYQTIFCAFLMVGLISLISGLIALKLNTKSILVLKKIIWIITISMLIVLFFSIISILTLSFMWNNFFVPLDYIFITGFGLLSFIYLIIDIWRINKMSLFNDINNQWTNEYLWFFGFKILSDLLNLLFYSLWLLLKIYVKK